MSLVILFPNINSAKLPPSVYPTIFLRKWLIEVSQTYQRCSVSGCRSHKQYSFMREGGSDYYRSNNIRFFAITAKGMPVKPNGSHKVQFLFVLVVSIQFLSFFILHPDPRCSDDIFCSERKKVVIIN